MSESRHISNNQPNVNADDFLSEDFPDLDRYSQSSFKNWLGLISFAPWLPDIMNKNLAAVHKSINTSEKFTLDILIIMEHKPDGK